MAEVGERQNKRIEGIFDRWDVPDDYARISGTYTSGKVKGEVRIKNRDIHSTAAFTNNIKKHTGLEVTLENERGEGIIYIPQEEIPPISELVAMEDSKVEYKSRTWSSTMEGTSVDSKLRFLDGKLAGKVYEGREFA